VVFDEARPSVNYWEPWYLGLEAGRVRKSGLITSESPRTGAYKELVAQGYDLTDLHALMAPRPFLVSGGSEDFPARWTALNHAREVTDVLGAKHREASNAVIYQFMEWALRARPGDGGKAAP
jgi:hypothetical protein